MVAFLWRNETDWPVEFVSENVQALFGHSAEEFISGKTLFIENVHPDDLDRVIEEVRRNSEDENRIDFNHEPYRIVTKNGEVKWVNDLTHIRRNPQGTISHYEGIVYDITDRKQAEQDLRESEQLLSNVFESMQEGVLVLNRDFEYTFWNRSMENNSQTPREEVLGTVPWEKFPFLKGDIENAMQNAMRGEIHRNIELKYDLPGGKEGWTQESYFPLKDSNGKVAGVVGIIEEITERKQSEKLLMENEEYLRSVFRAAPTGIGVVVDRVFKQVNERLCKITGYSEEELIG